MTTKRKSPAPKPARKTTPPVVVKTAPDAKALRSDILILMGNLLLHRGDGETALDRLKEAHNIAVDRKEQGAIAHASTELGRLHRYRNESEKARELYEKAVTSARRAKDHQAAGQALWEWGVMAHFAGDRKEAMKRLEEAAKEWKRDGSEAGLARVLALIANLHRKDGSLTKAKKYYEQAIALQRAVCDHYELGITLGNFALLQLAEGDREDGLATLKEAQQLLKGIGAEAEVKLVKAAAEPLLVQD